MDGGWDKDSWNEAIAVACAMAKKYYSKEEVFSLELEKERDDRDYLFGRLLAIADRVESHARHLQPGGRDADQRPTNAVRLMPFFATQPFRAWGEIYKQLSPHFQRLNGGEWYQRQIDEIQALFRQDINGKSEFENNKSLDGRYLMGYSLQRRELKKKPIKQANATKEDETNDN
jgi:CRISPR-associated protein Csd1